MTERAGHMPRFSRFSLHLIPQPVIPIPLIKGS